MTFDQYLTFMQIKQCDAAAELNISEGRVSQLRSGCHSISMGLARRIYSWSGGLVNYLLLGGNR